MKIYFCCSCLLFVISGLYAQSKKAAIKLSPLALIDEGSFPTIQGGIELSITNNISWYNEAGIKYRRGYYERADTLFNNFNGFKLKTELRYYLRHKNGTNKRMEGHYLAFNLFYTQNRYNTAVLYFPGNDSSKAVTDNFGVQKIIRGGNILFGQQKILGKNFVLEGYVGFGIRFRDITTVNKEFIYNLDVLRLAHDFTIHSNLQRMDSKAGKSRDTNFTLGFRLGYKF